MKWKKDGNSNLVEDKRRRKSRQRRESASTRRRRERDRDQQGSADSEPRKRKRRPVGRKAAAGGVAALIAAIVAAIVAVSGGKKSSNDGDKVGTAERKTESKSKRESESKSKRRGDKSRRTNEPPLAEKVGDTVTDDKELKQFLTFLVTDINDFWKDRLQGDHRIRYKPAKMVLFDGVTKTKCGPRRGGGGPAYCPGDQKMYIPPEFFIELRNKLDAPGDFAQALVVAHEMAHHVQLGIGVTKMVHNKKKRDKKNANKWTMKQELQADCLAGVWAHDVKKRKLLETGDLAEAETAIAAIGDDALQRQAGMKVNRKRFRHGSSAQRKRHFKRGFRRGRIKDCLRELKAPHIK